jgi:tetratricopeptide (TPR) repeat protein
MQSRGPLVAMIASALVAPAHATAVEPAAVAIARGVARYQAGDLARAAAILRRVPEAELTAEAGHYLGLALVRSGELKPGRRALAAAARLAPDRPRLLLDLGQAYLLEGNVAWAARTLAAAAELDPGDGPTRYYLGVALLRLGDASAAADELERARRLRGAPAPELAAQLGLAHYVARRYEASRRALESALADRRLAGSARKLLRAGLEAEGTPASLLSAELATGGVVDSNPLYEHETTAPTAVGPTLSGSLVLRPFVSARNSLWLELGGSRSFYFPAARGPADKPVGDASPSELRAGAGYARRLTAGDSALALSASYAFALTFLDGPPPLADAHHIFLEQHSGQLVLARGGAQSQLRYTLARSVYADLARSSWGNELAFEHGATFLGGRARLLGWLSLRYEAAHSLDYNQIAPGLGVGGSFLLQRLGLVIGLRLGYEYRNHLDSIGGVRWSEQRVDSNLAFTGELSRALPWGLRLRALYQRYQNFSTVESYDYGRDLVTLGLSWSTSS